MVPSAVPPLPRTAKPTPGTSTATPTLDFAAPLTSWNFDTGLEGWTLGQQISGLAWQNDGAIGGSITGTALFIYSPANLDLAIGNNKIVKIRLKNSTSSNQAQLFFTTKEQPGVDEAKYFALTDQLGSTSVTLDMQGNKTELRYSACPLRYTTGVLR
jgi:hypothetical protein